MEGTSCADDLSVGCGGLDCCKRKRKLLLCSSVRIGSLRQAQAGLATWYGRTSVLYRGVRLRRYGREIAMNTSFHAAALEAVILKAQLKCAADVLNPRSPSRHTCSRPEPFHRPPPRRHHTCEVPQSHPQPSHYYIHPQYVPVL
jgi:hypothetical protein